MHVIEDLCQCKQQVAQVVILYKTPCEPVQVKHQKMDSSTTPSEFWRQYICVVAATQKLMCSQCKEGGYFLPINGEDKIPLCRYLSDSYGPVKPHEWNWYFPEGAPLVRSVTTDFRSVSVSFYTFLVPLKYHYAANPLLEPILRLSMLNCALYTNGSAMVC